MDLLSPSSSPAASTAGPALTLLSRQGRLLGYFAGVLQQPSDYDRMTAALSDISGTLGNAVPISDIAIKPFIGVDSIDGTILIAVYPRPIALSGESRKVLTYAKWVGVQWGRNDGKPDRLVFGSTPYTIDGAFEVLADLADLKASLPSLTDMIPSEQ